MDVKGKKPTTEAGEYFRNSVWWWRPLWDYCEQVAPEICSKVKLGQSNDGDGLDARDSLRLAAILRQEIASGATAAFGRYFREEVLALPPEESCEICGGTGKRRPPPEAGPGTEWCNACLGKGKSQNQATRYAFTAGNVQDFAEFLEGCGGFEIW
jgi:hypothetical protein